MAAVARRRPKPFEPTPECGDGPGRALKDMLARTRTRRYVAHLANGDSPARDQVRAPNFLQAAIAFAETCAPAAGGEINIAVSDCETGEQHCFKLSV